MKHIKQIERSVAKILLFGFFCSSILAHLLTPGTAFAQQDPPPPWVRPTTNNPAQPPLNYQPVAGAEEVYESNVPLIDPKYETKNEFIPGVTLKTDGSEAGNKYSITDYQDPYNVTQIDPVTGKPAFFGAYLQNTQGILEAQSIGAGKTANIADETDFQCEFKGGFSDGMVYSCLAAGTYYLFFKPAYMVAGWASILLNYVIQKLVVEMGFLVNQLDGVMVAWQTLRDLANVFLVFLTIYVGIATILGLSKFGNKQLLWKIVLAALLVNFSITFTKGIIDVSNLAAVETYRQFLISSNLNEGCATQAPRAANASVQKDECIDKGLAGAFWTQLKVTTLFNVEALRASLPRGTPDPDIKWAMAITAFMGGLMCIVMAFVFGGAAFLLIGRFVILVFLIIVSPVALVAWLTDVSNIGSRWWKALLDQAFFAPAILLMWWIAYKVLGSYVQLFTRGGLTSSLASPGTGGDISGLGIVLMFIIVMAFLVMGLVIAKQLGAAGAQTVINTGKAGATATAGFMAANTLGRGSAYAQRKYAADMAEARRVGDDGKFINKSPVAMLKRGLAGGKIDRGLSAAAGAGANMKFAGRSSFADRKLNDQKNSSARNKELNATGKQLELREARDIVNSEHYATHQKAAHDIAKKTIANASQADIEQLRATSGRVKNVFNKDRFKNKADTPAMQSAFSKKQATTLAAKEDVSPMTQHQLTEAAYVTERTALRDTTVGAPAAAPVIQKMSLQTLEDNAEILKGNPGVAAHISPQAFKQLEENKNGKFDEATIAVLRDERTKYFKGLNDPAAIKKMVETSKPGDLATHDVGFLEKEDFLKNADTQILNEMQKNGLTKEKREAMKTKIDKMYHEIGVPNTTVLSDAEKKNVESLYDWFNNRGRFTV